MGSGKQDTTANFDPISLRAKYLEERDKRLRSDGASQFIDIEGEFAHFAEDIYASEPIEREPLTDEVDVLIMGGGFSGLQTAIHLKRAGVKNIRIIDSASDFGGTWYWNRYPGLNCDVESYIYLPMLEECGTVPTQKYVSGEEIFEHAKRMARTFDLYEHACFQTKIHKIHWDNEIERWIVDTDRGDHMKARFVISGVGVMSKPRLPGIPGINSFKGQAFHACRWDYDYTGGSIHGNLSKLSDKRVAVVGTGATAVQCIPHLAESCKELLVFQRTPVLVDVRNHKKTDVDWYKSQEPGWQRKRMENFDKIIAGMNEEEDLVGDSWTDVWRNLTVWSKNNLGSESLDKEAVMQELDFKKMEEIRKRVEDTVTDPATAELLKPYYNYFCKRPCYHDGYLQVYNRENVHLIDTDGKGVQKITENAIEAAGKSYEVDCIIFATGYDAGAPCYESGNFEIIGRARESLADKWADGAKSLHGMYSHGFPNFIVIGGIKQASVTVNYTLILGEQGKHAAALIKKCLDQGISAIEPSETSEINWANTIKEKSVFREQFYKECTPSYINKEGEVKDSLFSSVYGGGPFEYLNYLSEWLESGFEQDLNISYLNTGEPAQTV